jgi:hypothetical protein
MVLRVFQQLYFYFCRIKKGIDEMKALFKSIFNGKVGLMLTCATQQMVVLLIVNIYVDGVPVARHI